VLMTSYMYYIIGVYILCMAVQTKYSTPSNPLEYNFICTRSILSIFICLSVNGSSSKNMKL
jgi:hypothetical protein